MQILLSLLEKSTLAHSSLAQDNDPEVVTRTCASRDNVVEEQFQALNYKLSGAGDDAAGDIPSIPIVRYMPICADVVHDIPRAQTMTCQSVTHQLTHTRTRIQPNVGTGKITTAVIPRRPKSYKPLRLCSSTPLPYEENRLRNQFSADHPPELARRPRAVPETTGLEQRLIPLSGVMRDMMWKTTPGTPDDSSNSSEPAESTPRNNPWANEEPKILSSPSSQVSKASYTTSSPTKASSEDVSSEAVTNGIHADVSTTPNGADGSISVPRTRRRTVTKPTPHRFELADAPKRAKQTESGHARKASTSASIAEPPSAPPPRLGFSSIRTTVSTEAIITESSPPSRPPRLVFTPRPPKESKRKSDVMANNLFTSPATEARQQSYSSANESKTTMIPLAAAAMTPTPYHFVPSLKPLSRDLFNSRVVVITHGASQISSLLVRSFHTVGCRIIFGDPSPDRARQLTSSLGPLDIVHFNKCEVGNYSDIFNLFWLAMTMYGRVDHAIFGVGDDGAHAATIRSGESLWKLGDTNLTPKARIEEVSTETAVDGLGVGDIVSASARFARIALPFLQKGYRPGRPYVDKSLTFIASSASFTAVPNLPIYQISQHAVLGTVRALAETMDPYRGGVRVNGVITNMMIPTLVPQDGGRVGVHLPSDRPEDVSRIVLGVVGSGSGLGSMWSGRDDDEAMHGRILYVVREGAYDFQEGLETSEAAWMGTFAKESFDRAHVGYGNGAAIKWMLAD
ncbi:hypothetical protein DV736_g2894, partial [Chaetothyriales sp. CBS 134916]